VQRFSLDYCNTAVTVAAATNLLLLLLPNAAESLQNTFPTLLTGLSKKTAHFHLLDVKLGNT